MIIIAVSIEISMYFTNYKCMVLLVLSMFKCLKPKISIIWLKTLNGCDNMTSAQRVRSGLSAKKADLNLAVDDVMH